MLWECDQFVFWVYRTMNTKELGIAKTYALLEKVNCRLISWVWEGQFIQELYIQNKLLKEQWKWIKNHFRHSWQTQSQIAEQNIHGSFRSAHHYFSSNLSISLFHLCYSSHIIFLVQSDPSRNHFLLISSLFLSVVFFKCKFV